MSVGAIFLVWLTFGFSVWYAFYATLVAGIAGGLTLLTGTPLSPNFSDHLLQHCDLSIQHHHCCHPWFCSQHQRLCSQGCKACLGDATLTKACMRMYVTGAAACLLSFAYLVTP